MTPAHARLMARYNMWQNDSMIRVASTLSVEELTKTRGAAFRTIPETANHILWADQSWLSRIADHPGPRVMTIPESTNLTDSWEDYIPERQQMDQYILQWANKLTDTHYERDYRWYSGAMKMELTRPMSVIITHLFNHQTHHRGQIHAMMTEAGLKPDDTDIPFMPDRYWEL